MAVSEPSGARAQRVEEQEPPYDGAPGRTRLRSIHVPLPSGFVRTVQVYDVVNVGTDPNLREPALGGALHRFETGEVLAVPFVYHDPGAKKLALVVPEVLRHEELRLRAKHLEALADHADQPIPSYVREATCVIGVSELRAYLERPNTTAALGEIVELQKEITTREAQLETRGQDIEIQSEALTQREARLHQRAEQVTRREDELRAYGEEIEAAQADVAMREQELESRFESLRQREAELATREASPAALPGEKTGVTKTASSGVSDDDVVQIVDDLVEEDLEPAEALAEADDVVERVEDHVEDHVEDDVESVEDLEPLETNPGEAAEDLESAVQLVAEAPTLDPIEDVEEIVDDVEELEEVEAIEEITGLHAHEIGTDENDHRLTESKTTISDGLPVRSEPPPPPAEKAVSAAPPPPSVAPPAGFLTRKHGPEAEAIDEKGSVRIFARMPQGRSDLFQDAAELDLLVQLVVLEECPVVLVSLVQSGDKRPVVLRAALDPRRNDERRVIEDLRRKFEARVSLFDQDGGYVRTLEVAAPREVNAARILERVSKMRTASALDPSTAIERVLSAPPPVRVKDHPFRPADEIEPPKHAAAAREALLKLADWSSHDQMDHALLVLSIPKDQVDGTLRKVLEQAVGFGLPLPGRLTERAISLGVAADGAALVSQQIAAFAETSGSLAQGQLTPEQVAESWEQLLERAAENEVAIDSETHELAWRAIRKVRGDDGSVDVDPAKMPDMGAPELVMLLEHPKYRRDAAIELASRKDAAHAETLCKAVRKMPRAEVVRVVPKILEIGDGAGDALIDGLNARKTFVRQAFALSLAHLKLRRAVVPLVHLLASEESDVWKEIARVVGAFGTASLRNVQRQLKDPKGKQERYILTLAHLANHGCEKQVQKLSADDRPKVATMANEALTLREKAKKTEAEVLGAAEPSGNDAVIAFSRRFYEILEGKAPEADLEETD